MNVIAELESTSRGVYTGAIGFASPIAGLELNVAIRTFEFLGEQVWLGVGGGIVADSDPAGRGRECVTKARRCWTRSAARWPPAPRHPASARHHRGGWARGPAPARSGAPACSRRCSLPTVSVLLERHLERIARSAWTLVRGRASPRARGGAARPPPEHRPAPGCASTSAPARRARHADRGQRCRRAQRAGAAVADDRARRRRPA